MDTPREERKPIKNQLNQIPDKPGVYLMKNKSGRVIYVGKAINLKKRVRSYFLGNQQTPKEKVMVPRIDNIETIVTDSELEALILENNLIKKYRPKYNVNLKDDKNYPYLKVTTEEKFPRVVIARQMGKNGRHFGPYPNTGAARETIKLLRKVFPVRTCKGETPGKGGNKRPCLNYYINRCLAPCNDKVSYNEYREMMNQVIQVLEGKAEILLNQLEEKMNTAAYGMQFERAAEYRNQKNALEKIMEKQKIVSGRQEDYDIVALYSQQDQGEACVQTYYIRGGKMIGRNNYRVNVSYSEKEGTLLASFLKQYYQDLDVVPKQVLLSHNIDETEAEVIRQWLSEKRGSKVEIRRPQRGEKAHLMNMALKNARLEMENYETSQAKQRKLTEGALKELALRLSLPEIPFRLEGYDISHIQGYGTVASMVVFEGGKPKKDAYRRFRIRRVSKPDDYTALFEALERRFERAKREEQEMMQVSEAVVENYDNSDSSESENIENGAKFSILPDLLVIDGGKGQLNSALSAMGKTGYAHIPVIALAKNEEKVYIPGQPNAAPFNPNSEALKLLQQVRDEAHRFAVSYHRKTRKQETLRSELDHVPGIGEKRKYELYRVYTSLNEIRKASVEDLAKIPAMNRKVAQKLKAYLEEE